MSHMRVPPESDPRPVEPPANKSALPQQNVPPLPRVHVNAVGQDPSADRKEFRDQRHEFILQYYQMSVEDLGRHLGIGWQTIASVVGVMASLSVAEQGQLPIPI